MSKETPPRAWGRPGEIMPPEEGDRNTPTGVGKTLSDARHSLPLQKHPHGRGEDTAHINSLQAKDGNTPTGVGKTPIRVHLALYLWKHPHGRGEDVIDDAAKTEAQETPPRAWGRLRKAGKKMPCLRNTPTGVGKTEDFSPHQIVMRKHPHGRGEDRHVYRPFSRGAETPPRAWGRRIDNHMTATAIRNTPTGVGKTPQLCGFFL